MALRHTIRREDVRDSANRMIAHLAKSGTREDQVRREALIALTGTILQDNGAYAGYRYLNPPTKVERDGWKRNVYDETRVEFY